MLPKWAPLPTLAVEAIHAPRARCRWTWRALIRDEKRSYWTNIEYRSAKSILFPVLTATLKDYLEKVYGCVKEIVKIFYQELRKEILTGDHIESSGTD
jgi:hypothetical protein